MTYWLDYDRDGNDADDGGDGGDNCGSGGDDDGDSGGRVLVELIMIEIYHFRKIYLCTSTVISTPYYFSLFSHLLL